VKLKIRGHPRNSKKGIKEAQISKKGKKTHLLKKMPPSHEISVVPSLNREQLRS